MNEYTITITEIIAQALVKIICFYLGFLTIRLGYKLINDGIKGEFKFTASYSGVKGGLVSSSPGLLFVLLGILLIGYAMGVKKDVTLDTTDQIRPNTHQIPHPDHSKIDTIK